jgi:hypothetical protein
MRRALLRILLACAVAGVVGGCGNAPAPDLSPGEAPADEQTTGWELRGESELTVAFEPSPPRSNRPLRIVATVGPSEGTRFSGEVSCRFTRVGEAPGAWTTLEVAGDDGDDGVVLAATVSLPHGDVDVELKVDDRRFNEVQEIPGWRIHVE